jgi:hypothetical protein
MNTIDVIHQWHIADEAATAAEQALVAGTPLAVEGKGELPPADKVREARRLRAIASALFELKIAVMGDLVNSTVYGGTPP